MSATFHKSGYWFAGAISGAFWFLVALVLDSGWAIPTHRMLHLVVAILAAAVTGVFISLVFRRPFQKARAPLFLILPFATLPTAIMTFSVLLWLARLSVGVHFEPTPPQGDLSLIMDTYFIVLVSIFAPFLYVLALLNQYAMRFVLRRIRYDDIAV